MSLGQMIQQGFVAFLAAFATAAIVMYLWELAFEGTGAVDWGTALVMAVALGFALPIAMRFSERKTGAGA